MTQAQTAQLGSLLQTNGTGRVAHLVGVGGCGMSGLAHLLLDLNWRVSGSDLVGNSEVEQLRARGAAIHIGHSADQLHAARPALVVFSSAIREDNPELAAARELQLPIVRRATMLAALVQRQRGICVAGMHGKTTTTALLAYALEQLQARPSYAVGACVPQLERNGRFRSNDDPAGDRRGWFVAEADESDGTLNEFHPEHAIILNVDEEHLDHFRSLASVWAEFWHFARQTTGHLFYCADEPQLVQLFAGVPKAISFGFNPLATYRIENPAAKRGPWSAAGSDRLDEGDTRHAPHTAETPGSAFEIWRGQYCLGEFTLELFGEKNISNAAAVIALLHELGFAPAAIAGAIRSFRGVVRRQQELFRDARFRLFDDYGHHPTEIRATLRALRGLGCRRLLVAFQPHRYTRTRHLLAEFATCFAGADRLWLTDIYAASEPELPGVNGALLTQAVRANGQPLDYVASVDQLPRAVRAAMQPGDLVLFIGAGDITRAAHRLAAELREEMNPSKEFLLAEIRAGLSPGSIVRSDEPLAKRTTLRVGGLADFYVEPANEEDLARLLRFCAARGLPFMVLGRGSNLLIRDGGIRGVVISLCQPEFSRIEVHGDRLWCGAGAKLKAVAHEAKRAGLGGLEFLEGIPGSIGGALRMNAGAMGAATFEAVESVRFMDFSGRSCERAAAEVEVNYRNCPLFKTHIALGALLKASPAPREHIERRMSECSQKRWASQPRDPSAGCIFKNPAAIPAGKLIDELGLKGTRVGGAVVSAEHGNFIVNDGRAAARDVLELIDTIKRRVKEARGIELETEVEIVGEP
jgi:UDP-N-acetylmuramate--L-alanine ligase/UDP-N-acetylenolpyruvoylglucosamine reductase